ncbi:hypothetical protein, partial [Soonwooa sp.]|uniref:hypothetical protein n=1 Tax=Soonwooa sp. TaxID=1938592 RepID=UPI0028AB356F
NSKTSVLRTLFAFPITEKGFARCGLLQTESGEVNRTLAKTIFIFSNLQKKMKWFFADIF